MSEEDDNNGGIYLLLQDAKTNNVVSKQRST